MPVPRQLVAVVRQIDVELLVPIDATDRQPLMVVTGGAQGIGRGIVERALEAGYQVVAVDANASTLETLKAELASAGLHTAVVDVTDPGAVGTWVESLVSDIGVPTALVNNAGVVRFTPFEDIAFEDWKAVVDVNLHGVFLMTQHVGRKMIANGGGSIVSIGSVSSVAPNMGGAAYAPTKAAVAMMMRGVALEWGGHGVRANTVSPGYIETAMTAPIYSDPERAQQRLARVPVGRFGKPSDIADVVIYLCSDQAAYVTAQNLVVDGGLTSTTILAATPSTYGSDQER